jgi:hypothetical protein
MVIDILEFISIITLAAYLWWVSFVDASKYDLNRDTWKIDRFDDLDLLASLN